MYILDMPTDQKASDEAVELILLRALEAAVRAAGPAITHGQRIAIAGIDSLRDEIAKRGDK